MPLKKIDFFIESIKTMKSSGTVIQSGTALCKAMTKDIRASHKMIVEIGAGDGAITKHILQNMASDAILLSFEINESHFQKLSNIKDSRFIPICDSAEKMDKYLKKYDKEEADIIISALPFLVLPTELTMSILTVGMNVLKEKGLFVQFHYSNRLKHLYKSLFESVKTEFVLLNAPPAIVFRCINPTKAKTSNSINHE